MVKAVTIHGIKNCDTMKKARAWLDGQGIAHVFHDYKVDGIEKAALEGWSKKIGWDVLLNRSGTTFRALAESEKADLNAARAISLMLKQPSMIKRPVLVEGDRMIVGFKLELYEQFFA